MGTPSTLWLGTEFCSGKIPRNDSEQFPLFRGRKCSFQGIPRFYKTVKITYTELRACFSSTKCFVTKFRKFATIFVLRNGIQSVLSSAEWFRMESWKFVAFFVPLYGIPSIFLFRRMGSKQNSESLLLFFSTVRHSEYFYFPGIGSERNSLSFLSCGIAEILSEQTICVVYSVIHGIIFLIGNSLNYPAPRTSLGSTE